MRQRKIVVVGAGLVGGSAALFAALAIPSAQIIIIDLERVRAEGQVLDLAYATAFWGHSRFRPGDYDDARDADIIVITAGVGVKVRCSLQGSWSAPFYIRSRRYRR